MVFYELRWRNSIRAHVMTDTFYSKETQRDYILVSELSSWSLWL